MIVTTLLSLMYVHFMNVSQCYRTPDRSRWNPLLDPSFSPFFPNTTSVFDFSYSRPPFLSLTILFLILLGYMNSHRPLDENIGTFGGEHICYLI